MALKHHAIGGGSGPPVKVTQEPIQTIRKPQERNTGEPQFTLQKPFLSRAYKGPSHLGNPQGDAYGTQGGPGQQGRLEKIEEDCNNEYTVIHSWKVAER